MSVVLSQEFYVLYKEGEPYLGSNKRTPSIYQDYYKALASKRRITNKLVSSERNRLISDGVSVSDRCNSTREYRSKLEEEIKIVKYSPQFVVRGEL